MSLFKLKTVSTILIEDDYNKNILPLVKELSENDSSISIICYEQPVHVWQKIFNSKIIQCFENFKKETFLYDASRKSIVVIDSINQMALDMGWNECLKSIRGLQFNSNVTKLILILHRDCLLPSSKLHAHLNHIANAIITFDPSSYSKVSIQIKKSGKYLKSEETLLYDTKTLTLKLEPIIKVTKNVEEPERIQPANLTTFKIETDQIQQLQKNKLQLPYMSKINEGKGKVYYEPDAVDDWDDEDPDDDLDI